MMPYYSNMADPQEMAQMSGNPFYSPLQSGPDWVRGVQAIYGQMAQNKNKKKAEKEEKDKQFKEDLMFQLQLKAEHQATKQRAMELKRLEREAQDYVSPGAQEAARLFTEGIKASRDQRNAMDRIKAQTEGQLKVAEARQKTTTSETNKNMAALSSEYKKAKTRIEAAYTTDLTNVENNFSNVVATIKKNPKLRESTDPTQPNQYLIALRSAMAERKRKRDELEARKTQEMEALDREYSIKQSQATMPKPPEGFTIDIQ
jgi:hypothetical protein